MEVRAGAINLRMATFAGQCRSPCETAQDVSINGHVLKIFHPSCGRAFGSAPEEPSNSWTVLLVDSFRPVHSNYEGWGIGGSGNEIENLVPCPG